MHFGSVVPESNNTMSKGPKAPAPQVPGGVRPGVYVGIPVKVYVSTLIKCLLLI